MAAAMPHSGPVTTRMATPGDVGQIVSLIQPYAERGLVLPRRPEEVRQRLGNFIVAERDGVVVGCVALRDYGEGLEEIRTLAVAESVQGRGVGTLLVRATIHLARQRETTRLFALTVRPNLFVHLSFTIVPKSRFPAKVWSDCRLCAKRDRCDETAVVLNLTEPVEAGTAPANP